MANKALSAKGQKAKGLAQEIIRHGETSVSSHLSACYLLSKFEDDGWGEYLARSDGSIVGTANSQAYFARALKLDKSQISRWICRGRQQRQLAEDGKNESLAIANALPDGAYRPLALLEGDHAERVADACLRAKEIAEEVARKKSDSYESFKGTRIDFTPKITAKCTRQAVSEILGVDRPAPEERAKTTRSVGSLTSADAVQRVGEVLDAYSVVDEAMTRLGQIVSHPAVSDAHDLLTAAWFAARKLDLT